MCDHHGLCGKTEVFEHEPKFKPETMYNLAKNPSMVKHSNFMQFICLLLNEEYDFPERPYKLYGTESTLYK